ncbi:Uncharacterised protein [Segatella copri]|nr:Uncharacterised protein [Segatella copri]
MWKKLLVSGQNVLFVLHRFHIVLHLGDAQLLSKARLLIQTLEKQGLH